MTIARTMHSNNVVAGAGEVMLARWLDADTLDGLRYVGDSSALGMSVSADTQTVQSGDGATPVTLQRIVTSTSRSFAFSLRDINADNLALFFGGDAGTQANANTPVLDEEISIRAGRWYQIGQSSTRPGGWGAVEYSESGGTNGILAAVLASSKIVINDDADLTTPYKITTDSLYVTAKDDAAVAAKYPGQGRGDADILLDPKRGRIYISPYGALKSANPSTIYVNYTPDEPGEERLTIRSGTESVEVAMLYTEQSSAGQRGHDIYVRRMHLTANGEFPFKSRGAVQELPLSGEVLRSTDGYPDVFGIESMGPDGY